MRLSRVLVERYPELVSAESEPLRSFVECDFVASVSLGIRQERALARWTMYEEASHGFARRLVDDATLRRAVAEALSLSLEEFDVKAPAALRSSHPQGSFPWGAVEILESGLKSSAEPE